MKLYIGFLLCFVVACLAGAPLAGKIQGTRPRLDKVADKLWNETPNPEQSFQGKQFLQGKMTRPIDGKLSEKLYSAPVKGQVQQYLQDQHLDQSKTRPIVGKLTNKLPWTEAPIQGKIQRPMSRTKAPIQDQYHVNQDQGKQFLQDKMTRSIAGELTGKIRDKMWTQAPRQGQVQQYLQDQYHMDQAMQGKQFLQDKIQRPVQSKMWTEAPIQGQVQQYLQDQYQMDQGKQFLQGKMTRPKLTGKMWETPIQGQVQQYLQDQYNMDQTMHYPMDQSYPFQDALQQHYMGGKKHKHVPIQGQAQQYVQNTIVRQDKKTRPVVGQHTDKWTEAPVQGQYLQDQDQYHDQTMHHFQDALQQHYMGGAERECNLGDTWSGMGTGDNYCNTCFCDDGVLSCTLMACDNHIVRQDKKTRPVVGQHTDKWTEAPVQGQYLQDQDQYDDQTMHHFQDALQQHYMGGKKHKHVPIQGQVQQYLQNTIVRQDKKTRPVVGQHTDKWSEAPVQGQYLQDQDQYVHHFQDALQQHYMGGKIHQHVPIQEQYHMDKDKYAQGKITRPIVSQFTDKTWTEAPIQDQVQHVPTQVPVQVPQVPAQQGQHLPVQGHVQQQLHHV